MGNYYTRIARIYPKTRGLKLNREEIANSIVSSALLDYELNVLNSKQDDYVDICFRSKRGNGEYGLNLDEVDIWEIQGGDGTKIALNSNKIVESYGLFFFRFDEIEIKGEISNMDDLIKDIFPHYNSNHQKFPMKENDGKLFHSVQGIYNSNSSYTIGTADNWNRINYLELDQFLKLKGEYNGFDGCITSGYQVDNLSNLYKRFRDFEMSDQKEVFYKGLDYFQLNYKGRPVFQIKNNMANPYQKWLYSSSNWWDNCILPKWIKYQTRRKYAW